MKKMLLAAWLLSVALAGKSQTNTDYDYFTNVTFPGSFVKGDYIEFVHVNPIDANASGYYEVSISYTRGNIAAAATFIGSSSHANPSVWRELGQINSNAYEGIARDFTIDANTVSDNSRFRVRAVNTLGNPSDIVVHIKVRSINYNAGFTPVTSGNTGNDLTVNSFLPMTDDWNLYVGSPYSSAPGVLAIKALGNGYVGIGTASPQSELAVKGTITTQKIKVTQTGWADYVFDSSYRLSPITEVAAYINRHKHLPEVPAADSVTKQGADLGDTQVLLLKKIEELTLYMIDQNKKLEQQNSTIEKLQTRIRQLEEERK